MARYILFDLDGTLTDPAEGILGGVVFAIQKEGLPIPDGDTLRSFIGPPLIPQFMEVCGVDKATATGMLASYREYFVPRGMFQNRVYDGVPEMLRRLRKAGLRLAVATSKPEPFAEEILRHFGLYPLVDAVCGSTLDETRNEKPAVIAYALERLGAEPRDTVMVGDRRYDVEGAVACGLPCVGVLYGFGDREELTAAGATAVVESVEALTAYLLNNG